MTRQRWGLRLAALAMVLWAVTAADLAAAQAAVDAQPATASDSQPAASDSQPAAVAQAQANVPVVRAARLSFLAGSVSILRADNTGDDTPALNMPLYAGTRINTGDYGEAEIEFEDGSVARLVPRSTLGIDRLAAPEGGIAHTELSVAGGLVYFELRSTAIGVFRVSAAGTVATPTENAILRVRLDDPPASFALLGGAAHLERGGAGADGFRTEVHAGESLTADATDASRYFLSRDVASETWDRWNEERDRVAEDESDRRTVARDSYAGEQGYGWGDLDANGSWYNVPGQGSIWQPDAADASFDPYGYGAWVWGNGAYLYASGYSWGWTPYRCGQWLWFQGFGWGWQPNGGCGRFGFGGFDGGGFAGGSGPPHYRPVKRPLPGPGGVHPIVLAHGPDGARPPVHHGGPAKVAGTLVRPLPPLGNVARSEALPGGGSSPVLARDFPFEHGKPLLGVAPLPTGPRREHPVVTTLPSPGGAPVHRRSPGVPAAPGNGSGARGYAPLPNTLPPPPPPIQGPPPQPIRPAPLPAPAPVYHPPSPPPAPRPSAPPPAPAPVTRGGDTAPKGK